MSNSSIQPIDRTLSGATIPGLSGPGSDGNEGVLHIPQSSSITGTSPSDCFMSYPGQSLRGVLPLCRNTFSVFYSASRLGWSIEEDRKVHLTQGGIILKAGKPCKLLFGIEINCL